jgi:hypothetical protein
MQCYRLQIKWDYKKNYENEKGITLLGTVSAGLENRVAEDNICTGEG